MGSKKKVTTGYEYFGTFAQIIGIGPATRLTRVTNGDTEIWSGDITQADADGDGKTVLSTTIGTIHWFWGLETQQPSNILEAMEVDLGAGLVTVPIPNWKHVILFVADNIAFGQQPTPPTLKFEFERNLNLLTLATHHISNDAVIPEVLFDIYSNQIYGLGKQSLLDEQSFTQAAETVIDEGIGVSPSVDGNTTVRELIGDLLKYIDGYVRYVAGKIFLKLIRLESTVGLAVLDESNLSDEPRPINQGWSNTWNLTRAVFTDRENNWEDSAVEVWDDPANEAVVGEMVEREVRFPFVTRRAVIKKLVRRKGLVGGIPPMQWNLECLPSVRGIKPGDLRLLSFAKRGIANRVVRVQEVGLSTGENRTVRLVVQEELTRDDSNDYTPADDDFLGLAPYLDENGQAAFRLASTQPRLSWLTEELKDGALDGFLVVAHQPSPLVDGFKVNFTWDPVQRAYSEVDASTGFPFKGILSWWTSVRNGTAWVLRIEFQSAVEAQTVAELAQEMRDVYAVVGRRLIKTTGTVQNDHQPDAMWFRLQTEGHLEPLSPTILEIEFTDSAFGSTAPSFETANDPANYPTEHIYVGRREDFLIHKTDAIYFERDQGNGPLIGNEDTELVRYIKTPTFTFKDEQELSDVTAVEYDRDDLTMSEFGTYSVDWGLAVLAQGQSFDQAAFATLFGGVHPDQELTDNIDEALYAILFEFATEEQHLLADHTDLGLGFMVLTGVPYFNTTI